jgi:hypothetical protein
MHRGQLLSDHRVLTTVWHRIRFTGDAAESALELQRRLKAIGATVVAAQMKVAAAKAAELPIRARPARIYSHRETGIVVWHLDEGGLALYRAAGGRRHPEALVENVPDVQELVCLLNGRDYSID